MHEDIKLKLGLVTYISHTSISPPQKKKQFFFVTEGERGKLCKGIMLTRLLWFFLNKDGWHIVYAHATFWKCYFLMHTEQFLFFKLIYTV